MLPIGDDTIPKTGTTPFVSYILIGINILIFIYQISLDTASFEAFVLSFGTIPTNIINGEQLSTLITNMFLHGSWMHLIGNMLFLRVFGNNIEARMGNGKFVLFYLTGGIIASGVHILLNITSTIPAVGASGAIAAVLGAYLVMFPHSKIKMFLPQYGRIMYVPAFHFLGYRILLQIISGVGSIGATGGGTAWWAHIGGFLFGWLIGKRYDKKRAKIGEPRVQT